MRDKGKERVTLKVGEGGRKGVKVNKGFKMRVCKSEFKGEVVVKVRPGARLRIWRLSPDFTSDQRHYDESFAKLDWRKCFI